MYAVTKQITYKNDSHSTIWNEKGGVAYLTFPKLVKAGVLHGMSTRLGGVSKEHLGTMNLSYTRGDKKEYVDENHRIFAGTLGYDWKRLVFSDQVHKTNIRKVERSDCGKGIVIPSDIRETDGLMTNVPEIPLITFYADCVPLLFYDSVNRAIGIAHSGWKGTAAKIGAKMLDAMHKAYGTLPEHVIGAIAPSICQSCYEVSDDVIREMQNAFGKQAAAEFYIEKPNGKYQLDLQKACAYTLLQAGMRRENLDVTDICTCCNPDILFSHRASAGKRGNLAVVMQLSSPIT